MAKSDSKTNHFFASKSMICFLFVASLSSEYTINKMEDVSLSFTSNEYTLYCPYKQTSVLFHHNEGITLEVHRDNMQTMYLSADKSHGYDFGSYTGYIVVKKTGYTPSRLDFSAIVYSRLAFNPCNIRAITTYQKDNFTMKSQKKHNHIRPNITIEHSQSICVWMPSTNYRYYNITYKTEPQYDVVSIYSPQSVNNTWMPDIILSGNGSKLMQAKSVLVHFTTDKYVLSDLLNISYAPSGSYYQYTMDQIRTLYKNSPQTIINSTIYKSGSSHYSCHSCGFFNFIVILLIIYCIIRCKRSKKENKDDQYPGEASDVPPVQQSSVPPVNTGYIPINNAPVQPSYIPAPQPQAPPVQPHYPQHPSHIPPQYAPQAPPVPPHYPPQAPSYPPPAYPTYVSYPGAAQK